MTANPSGSPPKFHDIRTTAATCPRAVDEVANAVRAITQRWSVSRWPLLQRGHAESAHVTAAGWSDIDLSRLSGTSLNCDEDFHGSVIERAPTADFVRAAGPRGKRL